MKILALDLAMHRTGWACGGVDGNFRWGTFETSKFVDNEGQNLASFRDFLATFDGLSHMIFEMVFVNVRDARQFQYNGTNAQMALRAVALLHCHDQQVKPLEANISDWRNRWLGFSRKPKDHAGSKDYWKKMAVRAAADRGYYTSVHDEAEAIAILDYALANLDKTYKLKTNPIHGRQLADHMFKRGAHG